MKILLDYVFPITVISPTPQASTAFLKQVCLVVRPKDEVPEGITLCTNMTQVQAITNNTNAQTLISAGMNRFYILATNDLDIAALLEEEAGEFYTILISDDFDDADISSSGTEAEAVKAELQIEDILYRAKTGGVAGNSITINYNSGASDGEANVSVTETAITVQIEDGVTTAATIAEAIEEDNAADALVDAIVDDGDETDPQAVFGDALALTGGVDEVESETGLEVGDFEGVIGISSESNAFAESFCVATNRCAFLASSEHGATNLCFAFGKLLSNPSNWLNQQYIEMPESDDVDEPGEAEALFDDRISFVISDDEFGNRLGLFVAGRKAIVAPYILKNLRIDMQSRALQWISLNQPQYTKTEAALLETRLQEDVLNSYIQRGWISSGTVEITLVEQNFVANGDIEVPEPKALWRVFTEMRQTP